MFNYNENDLRNFLIEIFASEPIEEVEFMTAPNSRAQGDKKFEEAKKETLRKVFGFKQVGDTDLYIQEVIFNKPATIVKWDDGTKTVVKCGKHDKYDREKGLAMCIIKKLFGNGGNFNNLFKHYDCYQEEIEEKKDKNWNKKK